MNFTLYSFWNCAIIARDCSILLYISLVSNFSLICYLSCALCVSSMASLSILRSTTACSR